MDSLTNLLYMHKVLKPSESMIRHTVAHYNSKEPEFMELDGVKVVNRFDEMVMLYKLGLPLSSILTQLELYGWDTYEH